MGDEKKIALARSVYERMCAALDANNWSYDKDEENLAVHFGLSGEDVPMRFILYVDAARQLLRLTSPLPFKMNEDKRLDGAIATVAASYGLVDGSFDYDINDGMICFRMTVAYRDDQLSEELFNYMIACSGAMVEEYNDRFLALNKGFIQVTDFIKR